MSKELINEILKLISVAEALVVVIKDSCEQNIVYPQEIALEHTAELLAELREKSSLLL